MININELHYNCLPDSVEVDGRRFLVKTDYRDWLNFGEILKGEEIALSDIFDMFVNDAPNITAEVVIALAEFYACADKYPICSSEDENTLSYKDDFGYIYADFIRVYKIDLLACSLHWHAFISLLRGLSTGGISEIVSIRSYKGTDKDALKAKSCWRIQDCEQTDADRELYEALKNGGDVSKILKGEL